MVWNPIEGLDSRRNGLTVEELFQLSLNRPPVIVVKRMRHRMSPRRGGEVKRVSTRGNRGPGLTKICVLLK
jgi:hypothetical protein